MGDKTAKMYLKKNVAKYPDKNVNKFPNKNAAKNLDKDANKCLDKSAKMFPNKNAKRYPSKNALHSTFVRFANSPLMEDNSLIIIIIFNLSLAQFFYTTRYKIPIDIFSSGQFPQTSIWFIEIY